MNCEPSIKSIYQKTNFVCINFEYTVYTPKWLDIRNEDHIRPIEFIDLFIDEPLHTIFDRQFHIEEPTDMKTIKEQDGVFTVKFDNIFLERKLDYERKSSLTPRVNPFEFSRIQWNHNDSDHTLSNTQFQYEIDMGDDIRTPIVIKRVFIRFHYSHCEE